METEKKEATDPAVAEAGEADEKPKPDEPHRKRFLIGTDAISVIALCVSVAALLISGLSYRLSQDAQYHTQVVSFEQRKQEVRLIMYDTRLVFDQLNEELQWWKHSEDKTRQYLIRQMAEFNKEYDRVMKQYDASGSTPSTSARLMLENAAGLATIGNKEAHRALKMIRDREQAVPSK